MLGTRAQTVRFPISPASSIVVRDLYFPLASAPAAFWAVVRADGGDIRVTTQDGTTQCAREIVGFDYVNKTGTLFFAANGGSAFCICAGSGQLEPAAGDTIGKNSAWESYAKSVFHCHDSASPATDSTANGNNAASSGTVTFGEAGKIGNGLLFGGGSVAPESSTVLSGDIYSMMAWVRTPSVVNPEYFFGRGFSTLYDAVGIYQGKWMIFNSVDIIQGSVVTSGIWHHIVFTRNGTSVKLFVDGVQDIDSTSAIKYTNGSVVFGKRPDGDRPWNGNCDETRLYTRNLSLAEASQHCANQNNPSAFWTVGAAG